MRQEWALPGGLRGESGADAVVEDRHGVVWVGGRGSVGRLCGDRIELVRLPATFENAIVTALFEDREGALWIGTLTGDAVSALQLAGDRLMAIPDAAAGGVEPAWSAR
jgi:ligand-binding sensor domain-containing protein